MNVIGHGIGNSLFSLSYISKKSEQFLKMAK